MLISNRLWFYTKKAGLRKKSRLNYNKESDILVSIQNSFQTFIGNKRISMNDKKMTYEHYYVLYGRQITILLSSQVQRFSDIHRVL